MLFDEAFLYKLERLSVMSRRSLSGQLQGERRSLKRGQSVEFADFRPYSSGDDFRRIDWNAYARLERFFLKLFVEEEDLTVHILVDVTHSGGRRDLLVPLTKAGLAIGADGIMLEVHPNPAVALSDQKQQVDFATFDRYLEETGYHTKLTQKRHEVYGF